jgi:hypothetical protein
MSEGSKKKFILPSFCDIATWWTHETTNKYNVKMNTAWVQEQKYLTIQQIG